MRLSGDIVSDAFAKVCAYAEQAKGITGVPGLAMAYVLFDEGGNVSKPYCFGKNAQDEDIDADTLFQLASVSKPISSTIVALQVGRGDLAWNAPVGEIDTRYPLGNPSITVESLLAHRSGLPERAGDLLEDMGYSRPEILQRLSQPPLVPPITLYPHFSSAYAYTNFGYTLAAQAAAHVRGDSWEAAARRDLASIGLKDTVVTYDDFLNHGNRALLHQRKPSPQEHPPPQAPNPPFPPSPQWLASERKADAQAPAGGIASTLNDLIKWIPIHIAAQLAPSSSSSDTPFFAALRRTHEPYVPDATYGLGWVVGKTKDGDLRLGHSGGFLLGAATAVSVVPSAKIGIVVLTNGQPIGVPEALCEAFLIELGLMEGKLSGPSDFAELLDKFGYVFERLLYPPPENTFAPPKNPRPAQPLSAYAGVYNHPYFGPMSICEEGSALRMTRGPSATPTSTVLEHWDGDTFTYVPPGENGGERSGITFDTSTAPAVTLRDEHLFEPYTIGKLEIPPGSAEVDSWCEFYVLDLRLRVPADGEVRSVRFGAKTENRFQMFVYHRVDKVFLVQNRSGMLRAAPDPKRMNLIYMGLEVKVDDLIGFYQPSPGPIGYGFPDGVSHDTHESLEGPVLFTSQNSPRPDGFEWSSQRVYLFEVEIAWGLRGPGCATRVGPCRS